MADLVLECESCHGKRFKADTLEVKYHDVNIYKEGVWIEDCVELSRYIESRLNREDEDYELEVGSAGIGQPFKVLQQYGLRISSYFYYLW